MASWSRRQGRGGLQGLGQVRSQKGMQRRKLCWFALIVCWCIWRFGEAEEALNHRGREQKMEYTKHTIQKVSKLTVPLSLCVEVVRKSRTLSMQVLKSAMSTIPTFKVRPMDPGGDARRFGNHGAVVSGFQDFGRGVRGKIEKGHRSFKLVVASHSTLTSAQHHVSGAIQRPCRHPSPSPARPRATM